MMKRTKKLVVLAGMAALLAGFARGQNARITPGQISSLARSAAAAKAAGGSPASIMSVKNRARTLGDQPSPSATRYFSVSDADLRGLTPAQVNTRLSPTEIRAGDGIRRVEIVVEIQRPLNIRTTSVDVPVQIGTATLEASPLLKDIEVKASIFTSRIQIVSK